MENNENRDFKILGSRIHDDVVFISFATFDHQYLIVDAGWSVSDGLVVRLGVSVYI